MEFAVSRLYQLFIFDINPSFISEDDTVLLEDRLSIQNIRQEAQNINRYMHHLSITAMNKESLTFKMHEYQDAICSMLDHLFTYTTQYPRHQFIAAYNAFLSIMDNLYINIKKQYHKYFNPNGKVPHSYMNLMQTEISLQLNHLVKYLPPDLGPLITLPIQKALTEDNHITYTQIEYIKTLLAHIGELTPKYRDQSFYIQLIQILIKMNFNNRHLQEHLITIIKNKINSYPSLQLQIEKAYLYLKEINQLTELPYMALHSTMPSINFTIKKYVQNELSYLKNKQKMKIPVSAHLGESLELEVNQIKTDQLSEENLQYNLTVEELALFHRVMSNNDIIKNKNIRSMLRRVAKTAHTKHNSNVSHTSLYNNYFRIKQSTAASLYDKMLLMVNDLHKIKGKI